MSIASSSNQFKGRMNTKRGVKRREIRFLTVFSIVSEKSWLTNMKTT